jgi:hypothetical protein
MAAAKKKVSLAKSLEALRQFWISQYFNHENRINALDEAICPRVAARLTTLERNYALDLHNAELNNKLDELKVNVDRLTMDAAYASANAEQFNRLNSFVNKLTTELAHAHRRLHVLENKPEVVQQQPREITVRIG